MPVIRELIRTMGQVLRYSWHLRRPGLALFVAVVGVAAALSFLVGVVAPLAIYPLL